MKKNLKVKMALVERDMTQRQLAEKSGLTVSLVSWGISGRVNLTEEEKKKIAKALHKPVAELFEETAISA